MSPGTATARLESCVKPSSIAPYALAATPSCALLGCTSSVRNTNIASAAARTFQPATNHFSGCAGRAPTHACMQSACSPRRTTRQPSKTAPTTRLFFERRNLLVQAPRQGGSSSIHPHPRAHAMLQTHTLDAPPSGPRHHPSLLPCNPHPPTHPPSQLGAINHCLLTPACAPAAGPLCTLPPPAPAAAPARPRPPRW